MAQESVPNVMSKEIKQFFRSLREDELRDLVLVPLLEAMGYQGVQVTHGPREIGIDILFKMHNPLSDPIYCAMVVKAGKISGDVQSSISARTIYIQAQQCLDTPHTKSSGKNIYITRVYVCSNNEISNAAKDSIRGALKKIDNAIEFIGLDELCELIRLHIPSLIDTKSSAISRYAKALFNDNYFVKNLRLLGSVTDVPLHQCYVVPMFELFKEKLISCGKGTSPSEIKDLYPFILVCGGAGSGKSTFIQREVLELISNKCISLKRDMEYLPIIIQLRTVNIDIFRSKNTFVSFLDSLIEPYGMNLKEVRRLKGIHLFVDGIDEIQIKSARKNIIDLLKNIQNWSVSGIRVTRCVVTSRTYAASSIEGFHTAFLRPFGPEEIRVFSRNWFKKDPATANRLSELLLSRDDLRNLASSPLLLTLIAAVSENGIGVIKGSRTALYEQAVQLLSGKWDIQRGLKFVPSSDETLSFMMYLALELQESGLVAADERLLRRVVKRLRDEGIDVKENITVDECYERYIRTGFLLVNKNDKLEFFHKSISEYLCSRQIYLFHFENILKRNALDEKWWNIVVFYFGQLRRLDAADPDLVKSISKLPYLLFECAIEADRTPLRIREDILKGIFDYLASGRLKFTDEAISLVRLGSENIMMYVDELLNRKGPIQISFYLAVLDLLANLNDKRSRQLLRRFHNMLLQQPMTTQQCCSLVRSYSNGINSINAELLEEYFDRIGSFETAQIIVQTIGQLPRDSRKRRLFEKLLFDMDIPKFIEECKVKQGESESALTDRNELKTPWQVEVINYIVKDKRGGPLGTLHAVKAICANEVECEWLSIISRYVKDSLNGILAKEIVGILKETVSSCIKHLSREIAVLRRSEFVQLGQIDKCKVYRQKFIALQKELNKLGHW